MCNPTHTVWLDFKLLTWQKHTSILDSISGDMKKESPIEDVMTVGTSWDAGASELTITIVLIKATGLPCWRSG